MLPKAVKAEKMLLQMAVLLQDHVAMYPISLLTLEFINGAESALVIMRHCFLLKH
jgi:hypothetical protein